MPISISIKYQLFTPLFNGQRCPNQSAITMQFMIFLYSKTMQIMRPSEMNNLPIYQSIWYDEYRCSMNLVTILTVQNKWLHFLVFVLFFLFCFCSILLCFVLLKLVDLFEHSQYRSQTMFLINKCWLIWIFQWIGQGLLSMWPKHCWKQNTTQRHRIA